MKIARKFTSKGEAMTEHDPHRYASFYAVQSVAVEKLRAEVEQLKEENAKLRAALENIIEHQTIVADPSAVKYSGTAAIARKALQ